MIKKVSKKISILVALILVSAFLFGCSQTAEPKTKEVDAMTFLLAFQEGKADQYLGYTVKGEGREFSNYLMGMAPTGPLDIWLGTIGEDNEVVELKSWEEWSDAEANNQPMLVVELSGNYTRKEFTPTEMPIYTFSGSFNGETASKIRLVSKTGTEPPPYIVPVLTECTVE